MKLVIVGGVAGGATAAARARRVSESAEITVVERGPYVSYANCGLPYHISGDIEKRSALLLQTPEGFDSRYGVKVLVDTEAREIDRAGRRLRVAGPDGEAWLDYDSLILAQGGLPGAPPVPGIDAPNVFRIWSVPDMDRIQEFIRKEKPATAAIVGGGFIGLEMAEAFAKRGLAVTVVEALPRVMNVMDGEFGGMIAETLASHGVRLIAGAALASVGPAEIALASGEKAPADIVLVAAGVRPELVLARAAGLALGDTGALLVDEHLRTSDPHIWAAGDMVETLMKVSGKKVRLPLAGPANRQGRIAASNALGASMKYNGVLGSSVVKVFEKTAASTGLTFAAARAAGIDAGAAVMVKDSHAGYYPGGQEMYLTLVFDRKTARLLGAQAYGEEGVDKRIDVLAMALQGRLTLHDLAEVDLAYAPPYSSANDPVNLAAFVGENDLSGYSPLVTAGEVRAMLAGSATGPAAATAPGGSAAGMGGPPAATPVILDVRNVAEWEAGHIRGSLNIPVDELRFRLDEVPRGRPVIAHCRSGFRSHLALRILAQNGWQDVRNLTGGFLSVLADGGFDIEKS